MLILFAFTVDTEKQEVVFRGNITPPQALGVLQQIVITEGVRQAKEQEKAAQEGKEKPNEKKQGQPHIWRWEAK